MIKLGDKIKSLRKQRNISQEVLAQYLGVSFQAVSKWENSFAMPDISMIPAIASFFGVSIDELFDFNVMEVEKRVMEIVDEAYKYRRIENYAKAEEILREGLKKYPGNDILLNNLLYTMRTPERSGEVVTLCKVLIESTHYDDIKYDALRILAETYKEMGEYELTKSTIEKIPEIYFTKLELDAELLEGDDQLEAAHRQKGISADSLVEMLEILAECYEKRDEIEKSKTQLRIAKRIIEAFSDDFSAPYASKTFYDISAERLKSICNKLS